MLVSGGYDKAIIIWQFKESKEGEVIIKQKMKIISTLSLNLDSITFEDITQIDEGNKILLQQNSNS